MDDLISREAALEAVKIPNGEYPNPSERHGIIIARVEARRRIMVIPSVPAVPLDKLCEMLSDEGYCAPYPNDPASGECDQKTCKECWKSFLTKWMEGLDAEVH